MHLLREKIREYSADRDYIIAVYLFGSLAGGSFGAKKTPDVDLAVLLDDDHPYADTLDAKMKMEREIEEFVGREFGKIDLSVLNEAPPVFAHEVLKCRTILFERDKEKSLDFEFKAEWRYLDTKPMREYFWKEMVERIKGGTFGYPK